MRQNGYITDRDYAVGDRVAADRGPGRHPVGRSALFRGPGQRLAAEPVSRTAIFSPTRSASTPLSTWICSAPPPKPSASACRRWTSSSEAAPVHRNKTFPEAQVALVAIDPHTGRGQGPGRRTQLRRQPVEPRAGQAAAGFDFQAFRLRGRARYGGGRRAAHPDRRHHGAGRAHHLLVRRQALRAEQLRAQVLRRRSRCARRWPIDERGHGESGRDGGLRQRWWTWPTAPG